MKLKDMFLINIKEFLDKLDDDISEIYEEQYKSKVAINTLILLLVKKGVFTEKEFKDEMSGIRKMVKRS